MKSPSFRCLLAIVFLTAVAAFPCAVLAQVQQGRCQSCHSDPAFTSGFSMSVHGHLSCGACHRGIDDIRLHSSGEKKSDPVRCASCHSTIAEKYKTDVHAVSQNMACTDCHQKIHVLTRSDKPKEISVQEKCVRCHAPGDYAMAGHGRAVAAGNPDTATCTDCHSLHAVAGMAGVSEKEQAALREAYTQRCKACHADPGVAERNNLSTAIADTYDQTYHGKVLQVGYAQRVAGCADCHTGHNTLPSEDPASAMHPENLYAACKTCHPTMHQRFVSFEAHPGAVKGRTYLALHIAEIFMIGLLVGVFAFFWIHTLLWWWRAYLDKCRRRKAGFIEDSLALECREEKQIQRFTVTQRVMHVLLILSFFTLVMTGFPIKYSETAWAKVLVNLWGGPHMAGLFHRIAALVLCALFLYTLWLSIRFLFPKWRFRGWLGRLFGPDSLFPNLKDLQDIKGMFLWFFGRGPMPKLDRWTYWEKFDFLAVFWGMTAIGLSGFMLWFPGPFSYIVPGWVINIATIVHSEEAFLAAVFIFTVHFFNNHIVPNKFPLEPNIFTGRYRLDQMREERPLEYERMVAEGKLDSLKREGPGLWSQLFASVFGLGSLVLGIILLVLIFWAVLFY
ncbi:MAG TPA: multiheme c-type cytochrome [Smithellaceae bacterium]|nr:multiheme c-type cytochrome [Smithellaceae bacterium]